MQELCSTEDRKHHDVFDEGFPLRLASISGVSLRLKGIPHS